MWEKSHVTTDQVAMKRASRAEAPVSYWLLNKNITKIKHATNFS
jgi:hypothetical protein